MPGFYITNYPTTVDIKQYYNKNDYLYESAKCGEFQIQRMTLKTFLDDKLFCEINEYFVVLEGVIFNKQDLLQAYGCTDLSHLVGKMIEVHGLSFFEKLDGLVSGAILDKKNNRWITFTDALGQKGVFYYSDKKSLVIGSQLIFVTDTMKLNHLERKANIRALSSFVKLGCYSDLETGIEKVFRLYPGNYLIMENSEYHQKSYFKFDDSVKVSLTDDEAIEQLDKLFLNAVNKAITKNSEYGYVNLVDISGGADTRAIVFATEKLSQNISYMHYSQIGSNEKSVSEKIVRDFKHPFYYESLDDALFFKAIDEYIQMNSGTAYYCGITGGLRVLEKISQSNFGIEFSGVLGNVYDGTMLRENGENKPDIYNKEFVFSNAIESVDMSWISSLNYFKTDELFWFYNRGMMFGMSTFLSKQYYIEPFTPFGDKDFVQFWLSIPWKQKRNKLLLKWLYKKYPKSMEYNYASLGYKLKYELSNVTRVPHLILYKMKEKYFLHSKGCNPAKMNPFDYYERTAEWLIPFINAYINENLPNEDSIKELIVKTQNGKGIKDKYISASLASYYKNFIQ